MEEAFENAAKALEDTLVSIEKIKPQTEEEISVSGKDIEALLYSWLEALIIRLDETNMLFSKFKCKISRTEKGFLLEAKVFGEKFDPKRHEEKTGVKAPTYHGMKVEEKNRQITLRFILDL